GVVSTVLVNATMVALASAVKNPRRLIIRYLPSRAIQIQLSPAINAVRHALLGIHGIPVPADVLVGDKLAALHAMFTGAVAHSLPPVMIFCDVSSTSQCSLTYEIQSHFSELPTTRPLAAPNSQRDCHWKCFSRRRAY